MQEAVARKESHMKLAKVSLDAYTFPVTMLVQHPNGSVIASKNANDFLDHGYIPDGEDVTDQDENRFVIDIF